MPTINRKIQMLLIEKNATSQKVVKLLLETLCECDVEPVSNLQSALGCLEKDYDIIFTDIYLPDGDGKIFIQKYHAKHPTIPIVAMGTYIANAKILLDAGAVAVLRKPISSHIFKELMEKFIPR
jgi:CheY-like chemotaxis protein